MNKLDATECEEEIERIREALFDSELWQRPWSFTVLESFVKEAVRRVEAMLVLRDQFNFYQEHKASTNVPPKKQPNAEGDAVSDAAKLS